MQLIDCADLEKVSKQSRSALANKCSNLVVAAQDLSVAARSTSGVSKTQRSARWAIDARAASDIRAPEKTRIAAPAV